MTDVADFLDYGGKAFKFVDIGDAVGGTVTSVKIIDGEDLSRPPKPVRNLVVSLETREGEEWSVWTRPGQMLSELSRAVKEGKPGVAKPTIEEGDKISFTFVRTEPSKTPGFNPRKIYAVQYKPRVESSSVSADSLI